MSEFFRHSVRDIVAKSRFSRCSEFMHVPRDTEFIEYIDEIHYLHFALTLDAK